MPSKYQIISELASQTARDITSKAERYTDFLVTAANNYKYSFKEQLLIHAQKPDATACAEIETWNRLGRWVNKGTRGIALLVDRDKTDTDGHTDVFVRAEDASKINRIFERFGIATTDLATARGEIVKANEEKNSDRPEPDRHTTEKDKDEAFVDAMLAKQPNKEEAQTQNPTEGRNAKSRQSEPTSRPREKTDKGISDSPERSRKSVRETMKEIREEQRQRSDSAQRTKDVPTKGPEHIEVPKKKREKER